jgi:hypothetical protein
VIRQRRFQVLLEGRLRNRLATDRGVGAGNVFADGDVLDSEGDGIDDLGMANDLRFDLRRLTRNPFVLIMSSPRATK